MEKGICMKTARKFLAAALAMVLVAGMVPAVSIYAQEGDGVLLDLPEIAILNAEALEESETRHVYRIVLDDSDETALIFVFELMPALNEMRVYLATQDGYVLFHRLEEHIVPDSFSTDGFHRRDVGSPAVRFDSNESIDRNQERVTETLTDMLDGSGRILSRASVFGSIVPLASVFTSSIDFIYNYVLKPTLGGIVRGEDFDGGELMLDLAIQIFLSGVLSVAFEYFPKLPEIMGEFVKLPGLLKELYVKEILKAIWDIVRGAFGASSGGSCWWIGNASRYVYDCRMPVERSGGMYINCAFRAYGGLSCRLMRTGRRYFPYPLVCIPTPSHCE